MIRTVKKCPKCSSTKLTPYGNELVTLDLKCMNCSFIIKNSIQRPILIKQFQGCKTFKVKDYIIDCLDDVWMCSCSLKYNRDINTDCKHIEACKKLI